MKGQGHPLLGACPASERNGFSLYGSAQENSYMNFFFLFLESSGKLGLWELIGSPRTSRENSGRVMDREEKSGRSTQHCAQKSGTQT